MLSSNKESGKPTLLIVGAGGFIGGFIAAEGIRRGYDVYAAVRESTSRRYLKDLPVKYIVLDYDDPDELTARLEQARPGSGRWNAIIYNLGATKAARFSDFNRVNYTYLRDFVEAIHEIEAVPDKFLYMSSLSALGPKDEKNYTPYDGTETPEPNTRYGLSKIKAETHLATQLWLPWIIFRPTGVYGPREKDYLMMVKSIDRHFVRRPGLALDRPSPLHHQRAPLVHPEGIPAPGGRRPGAPLCGARARADMGPLAGIEHRAACRRRHPQALDAQRRQVQDHAPAQLELRRGRRRTRLRLPRRLPPRARRQGNRRRIPAREKPPRAMSLDEIPTNPMPWWLKALIVLLTLPVLGLPWLWAGNIETDTGKTLLFFYPVFAVLAAWCAWKAWARNETLTWILLALMLLTDGAMYLLCYPPL